MTWVQTATSMISFGFTIYKFFQFEVEKIRIHQDSAIEFAPCKRYK
jgi:uncharacterized membrane protein YidH (DUF202 family)